MDCRDFQEDLPDIVDGVRSSEQEKHLKSCQECSELAADLTLISEQARLLRGLEEPSPRVWNSIEIALRQEGLIHEPRLQPVLVPAVSHRWHQAWWYAATAVLLITFGSVAYQRLHNPLQVTDQAPVVSQAQKANASVQVAENSTAPTTANSAVPADDQQLLEVVSTRAPGMRASYETDLRKVNAYIRDAEEAVRANPNDEEAQQCLMQAYEQKAMIYEMALHRLQ